MRLVEPGPLRLSDDRRCRRLAAALAYERDRTGLDDAGLAEALDRYKIDAPYGARWSAEFVRWFLAHDWAA